MSALSGRWGQAERSTGGGAPGYGSLLSATLVAQLVCGVALWMIDVGLSIARLAPGSHDPFLLWHIDGPWAVVGAAGWAYLVSRLIARVIIDRLGARDVIAPSAGWTTAAVAIGGYGALAVGHTTGIRTLLAVTVTPLVLGALAYTPDGRPRRWPVAARGRTGIAVATAALLVAFAYSIAHPFTALGSGGNYGLGVNRLAAGHDVEVDIGLGGHLLPTQLTGVTLDQAGVIRSVALSGAPTSSPGVRLPAHLAAGERWLRLRVGLSCPTSSTTIDQATLHYRVLGIPTSQRIALGERVRLACRG